MSSFITDRALRVEISINRMVLWCAFILGLLGGGLLALKPVEVGPYALPGGAVLLPVCYEILVVTAEVYGPRVAVALAVCGFTCLGVGATACAVVVLLPSAPYWPHRDAVAFDVLFGFAWAAYLLTIAVYAAGLSAGLMVFAVVRQLTSGRLLWLRIFGAPAVAQAVSSALFVGLVVSRTAAAPPPSVVSLVSAQIGFAVALAATCSPLVWLTIIALRRSEFESERKRGKQGEVPL